MADLAQHDFIHALATTLLHFLWQGLLIGAVAAATMRLANSAGTRYAIGVGSLVVMLIAPVVTFATLIDRPAGAGNAFAAPGVPAEAQKDSLQPSAATSGHPSGVESAFWSAAGVTVWLAGIFVLSVRLAGGWVVARRMARRSVQPAAAHIQVVAAELALRLGLRRAVRVLESSAVAVPVLVGWLRPVVVFPLAALAGLSPAQIEALLVHELAHVRRHDYLVNVLQSCAEVILFYHPVVWWLSRRVRAERELCCDDVAVGLCDRLVYATALTDLAAMMSPRVALAATGGDLVGRVRRILGREESVMSAKSRLVSGAVILVALVMAVPVLFATVRQSPSPVLEERSAINQVEAPAEESEEAAQALLPGEELEAVAEEQSQRSTNEVRAQAAEIRKLIAEVEVRRKLEEQGRKAEIDAARAELARVQKMFEVGLAPHGQLIEAKSVVARMEAFGDEERQKAIDVELMMQKLADARKRVEVGVLAPDELARMEIELQKLVMEKGTREFIEAEMLGADKQLERARMLMERGLLSAGQLKEQEKVVAELQRKAMDQEIRIKSRDAERKVKEISEILDKQKGEQDVYRKALEDYQQKLVDVRRQREVSERKRELVVDRMARDTTDRAIVAGDSVFVTIEGETQLPTIYRIDGDGTIRVPLLGTFKVIGQTPSQVRLAIGKKLSDSRLGSEAKVSVTLGRTRVVKR